ncbi:hypothetical protein HKX48_008230 [Thoreauomyces humboldtii]|nr:hypothetical protein HKX48_008230 [Thoreauomyces humboldtii]
MTTPTSPRTRAQIAAAATVAPAGPPTPPPALPGETDPPSEPAAPSSTPSTVASQNELLRELLLEQMRKVVVLEQKQGRLRTESDELALPDDRSRKHTVLKYDSKTYDMIEKFSGKGANPAAVHNDLLSWFRRLDMFFKTDGKHLGDEKHFTLALAKLSHEAENLVNTQHCCYYDTPSDSAITSDPTSISILYPTIREVLLGRFGQLKHAFHHIREVEDSKVTSTHDEYNARFNFSVMRFKEQVTIDDVIACFYIAGFHPKSDAARILLREYQQGHSTTLAQLQTTSTTIAPEPNLWSTSPTYESAARLSGTPAVRGRRPPSNKPLVDRPCEYCVSHGRKADTHVIADCGILDNLKKGSDSSLTSRYRNGQPTSRQPPAANRARNVQTVDADLALLKVADDIRNHLQLRAVATPAVDQLKLGYPGVDA